jgi:hypothetical protein
VQQNFQGRQWLEPFDGAAPLPFAPVSLIGENGNYAAKTDIDGRYSFEPVKPGTYLLEASRPPWRLEKSEIVEITKARPCAQRILNMRTKGAVRGRVIGAPATGVHVELVRRLSSGRLANHESLRAKTDAQGRFSFEDVPSAAFAIGVNIVSAPTHAEPFRDVRFGRVIDTVPDGDQSDIVFELPQPIEERLVTVKVFWADGTPVADRVEVFANFGRKTAGSGHAVSGNIVTLRLLHGLDYELSARRSLLRQGGGEHASSGPVTLPAGNAPAVVEIRMRERRP